MEKCEDCGRAMQANKKCEYCGKTFCEDHMPKHHAWEHRHEGLADDASRLWKRTKNP